MSKAPAFQFYAADFLVGTAAMTNEEVGIYIRLLCFQWDRDGLPAEPKALRFLCLKTVPESVLEKFPIAEDGLRRNPKLERVRAEQLAFRQSKRIAGSHGGKASGESRRRSKNEAQTKHSLESASVLLEANAKQTRSTDEANAKLFSLQSSDSSTDSCEIQSAREGGERFRPLSWPTLDHVKAKAEMIGLPEAEALNFWNHFESTAWLDKNGHPVHNWQSKLATWKATYEAKENEKREKHNRTDKPNPRNTGIGGDAAKRAAAIAARVARDSAEPIPGT